MRSPVQVWSAAPLKNTTLVVFFNLCKVCLHKFVRFISKSRVEPVVCARRLRILRALIAFSCRQQLYNYRLFTTKLSCFLICAKFVCTNLCDLFLNRAWSLSSALGDQEYFVLSSPSLAVQQLILSAFIDVNFGESVVCFGFST